MKCCREVNQPKTAVSASGCHSFIRSRELSESILFQDWTHLQKAFVISNCKKYLL